MKKVLNLVLCLSTALVVSGCWKKSHEGKNAKGHHAKVADHSHDQKQEEKVAESANDTADSGTTATEDDPESKTNKTSSASSRSGFFKKLASLFRKKDKNKKVASKKAEEPMMKDSEPDMVASKSNSLDDTM